MTTLSFHLRFAGAVLVLVGLAHVLLPRRLGWKEDLAKVSLLNRQVSYVHAYFVALACVLFGLVPLLLTTELLRPSPLGKAILAGEVVFFGSRLVIEVFVLDEAIWVGDRPTTRWHRLFLVLWTYITAVFGWGLVHLLAY